MKEISRSLLGKLMLICGGGTLLIIATITYALLQFDDSTTHYRELLDKQVAAERAILHLEVRFKIQVQEWKDTLIRGADPKAFEKYWGHFQKEEASIQNNGQQLLGQLNNPKARELLRQFLAAHEKMGQAYRKGLEAFKASGNLTQAGDRAVKGIDRAPTRLLDQAAREIARSVRVASDNTNARASNDIADSVVLMSIAMALTFIALVWGIRRMILTPLNTMVDALRRLAEGDFTQPVIVDSRDEIGRLALSAEKIRQELGAALRQVIDSSATLAKESEQFTKLASVTTDGVNTQQRETDQVAAAINEMTATVAEVARSAADAAEAAGQADQESSAGQRIVAATVENISSLAEAIEGTTETINHLAQDSDQIGAVIDVINGIAEQTNLLALNAAIEAARAGDQGRGFAVVADEVRTLASRTQRSTQEIQSMIERLQAGARRAAQAMNDNREQTQETVRQAAGAGDALKTIAAAVTRISDMNSQIAGAAQQQGAVAEDINRNITQIGAVAEQSASGAQRITQASQDLDALAKALQQLTRRFVI